MKAQKRRTFFKLFRYGGLLVTALGVAAVLVPATWLEMLEGVSGYLIVGGSILNAIGRLGRESIVWSRESAVPDPSAIVPDSSRQPHPSPALTIAEALQDAALIL